jgi:hypothetical protein
MRRNRTLVLGLGVILALAATSQFASAGRNKGKWTYIDTTPDPTVVQYDGAHHCSTAVVPASPVDVNSHTFKARTGGTLKLTAHNAMDWAMEVQDKRGNVITGQDGPLPTDPESISVSLRRGTYKIVYCNFAGEPQITVNYKFISR